MAKEPAKLTAEDGRLYLGDLPLMHRYEAGDADSIAWPDPNPVHLAIVLYGKRESGEIPNLPAVILPDGENFDIENNLG